MVVKENHEIELSRFDTNKAGLHLITKTDGLENGKSSRQLFHAEIPDLKTKMIY